MDSHLKEKVGQVLSALQLIASLALTFGVRFLFHACKAHEGRWMSCHWAEQSVFYLGIGLIILSLGLFIRNRGIQLGLLFSSLLAEVLVFFTPGTIIGLCMKTTMRCHTLMKPAVTTLASILVLITVAHLLLLIVKKDSCEHC